MLAERWGIQVPPGLDTHPDPKTIHGKKKWVDLAHDKLDLKAVGLNHFIWIVDVRDRASGEDLYPLFRQRYLTTRPDFEPLARKMFEVFGLCPAPGHPGPGPRPERRAQGVVPDRTEDPGIAP